MESTDFLTALTMGIMLGGLYALIAQGLSLVFGVMRLINVAHGDLVVFGSYFGYAAMTLLGIDPILSLVAGIPIMFALGFLIQRYLLNRASRTSMEAPLIIALGLSIILQNLYQLVFSPMSRGLTTSYALKSFSFGEVYIPFAYVLDFLIACVVMFALRGFIGRTYLGRAINAASQDRKAAQLMGINADRVYAFSFAIAMVIAGISGVCFGLTFPFVPTSGVTFLIIAFGVVVLGGLGSILGTFVGGIAFGLAQTFGSYFFGVNMQLLIAYVMVLVVLSIRPQGIFGGKA
ncbi:MAG: branched-chain amino acid ABC transporter permease [Pseudomonadota bacterium]